MDPISMAPLIVGAVALAEDMYQMYATRRMIETSDTPRIIAVMGVTGAGKSTCIQKPSTTHSCLQFPGYTIIDTPGFDDSEACLVDDEALSSHIGSHLELFPSATSGNSELIRSWLQKPGRSLEGIMREDRRNECKDTDGIGHLCIDINDVPCRTGYYEGTRMWRESTIQLHDMPCSTGYYEGTRMEREKTLLYGSFQSLQRGIANAIERARLKIDSSNRCDLRRPPVEKYSPSASRTQPGIGKGAHTVTHRRAFCRCYEQSSGRELGLVGVSCLILGKTICPLLQWLCLQSLQSEPRSILDQSLIDLVPSLSPLVATSGRHHTITLSMMFVSTSLTVLALFIPFSRISERCRSPVLVCCWMALVASGPLWTYIGGSAASFFLVFMPYAMSVGFSIGLLGYWGSRKRDHQMGMKQEELERRAGWSDFADTK